MGLSIDASNYDFYNKKPKNSYLNRLLNFGDSGRVQPIIHNKIEKNPTE